MWNTVVHYLTGNVTMPVCMHLIKLKKLKTLMVLKTYGMYVSYYYNSYMCIVIFINFY